MSILNAYLWTVFGIFLSLVIPEMIKILKDSEERRKGLKIILLNIFTKRVLATIILPLAAGFVIVIIFGEDLDTKKIAFMNGFCWQSLLDRVVK